MNESRQAVDRLGLCKQVEFVGNQQPADLAKLYQQARCLVVPSRSPETFCQVGIEAMSYGLPVVAADVGGVREWLMPNANGFLCRPNDSQSLADTLKSFLSDPSREKCMRDAARQTVAEHFQPSHHLESLNDLLRQCACR